MLPARHRIDALMSAVWQVCHSESGPGSLWRDFPEDLNKLCEATYEGRHGYHGFYFVWPAGTVECTEFYINFDTMMQTNRRTGMERRVRRVELS